MELTVKDVLKMENIMNKVKDVVSNSVTITDHKSAGSIRLTECTMREFEGFDICYLADNKEVVSSSRSTATSSAGRTPLSPRRSSSRATATR